MSRPRFTTIRVAAAVAAATLVLLMTTGAGAQNEAFLLIRSIDSKSPNNTQAVVMFTGNAGDVGQAKFVVNGKEIQPKSTGKLDAAAGKVYLSMVIDTGPNISSDGSLEKAREALVEVVDKAPAGVTFGVFYAGDKASTLQAFTQDKEQTKKSIEKAGASQGKVALYDAIRQAAAPFQSDPTLQGNILIVTGDSDSVALDPIKALTAARGAVLGSGAATFVVAQSGRFDSGPIDQLVADGGGRVRRGANAQEIGDAVRSLGTAILDQQYRIDVDLQTAKEEIAEIELTIGGQTAKSSLKSGGIARGSLQLQPKEAVGGGGIPVLDGPLGLALVVAFTMVGFALLAYALTLLVVPDDSLSSVLRPYADGYSEDGESDDGAPRSALIQGFAEQLEQVADSGGYLASVEGSLERANISLRAGEALTAYLGVVLLATLFGLLLTRSLVAGLIFGGLGAMLPVMVINFIARRRRKRFMNQLPDTLSLLSGTLRAGYSLMQGIEAVSQEVEDPMGLELRRVVTESRLGRPVEEALDSSADRMASPDFAWAVMAIRIQREVGGNLAELLLTVAETMTARERLRRDVAALTAEGRMSAIVLGLLPPGLGLVMFVMNPDYTGVLFTDTLGIILLVVAGIAMLVGFLWMRKIINIEI